MAELVFGTLGLAVLLVVAAFYRGDRVPRAAKMTGVVTSVAQRVDPGEAPPQGVLTTPEKSRAIAARIERIESRLGHQVKSGARALAAPGRAGQS